MTSKDVMMASVALADFDVFRRHDGTELTEGVKNKLIFVFFAVH